MHSEEPISALTPEEIQAALNTGSEAPPENPEETGAELARVARPRGGNPNWPGADMVKDELTKAAYDTQQISDVLWLFSVAKAEKLKTYVQLCERIHFPRHETVLARIMRGKYADGSEAIREQFFAKVRAHRSAEAEKKDYGADPIAETSVVVNVSEFCSLTRSSATISILWGRNRAGKTKALQLYRDRNNHGRTILVRMPVGGAWGEFLDELCKVCNFSSKSNQTEKVQALHRYFDETMLLIVDEAHQVFSTQGVKFKTLERIREIHDRTGCGVVLCGTKTLPNMMSSPKYIDFLGQISNRGVLELQIPTEPTPEDLALICEANGLGAPTGDAQEIVDGIAKLGGVGRLAIFLRMTRKLAANQKQTISWAHFMTAYATLLKWKGGAKKI